jgi:hypothetical protein
MELFDEATVQRLGTALTPSHYGCYKAFKDAILSEFNDEEEQVPENNQLSISEFNDDNINKINNVNN